VVVEVVGSECGSESESERRRTLHSACCSSSGTSAIERHLHIFRNLSASFSMVSGESFVVPVSG